MKSPSWKLPIAFVTVLMMPELNAQNLLSNPDFEEYTTCPTHLNQVDRLINWIPAIHTPDYYNCEFIGHHDFPSTTASYSGTGFTGIVTALEALGAAEAIAQQLNDPLLPGISYHFSFAAKIPFSGFFTDDCGGIELFGFRDTLISPGTYIHASTMTDAIPIGASGSITSTTWELHELYFQVSDTINYLLITIEHAPYCSQYIFLDSLELKSEVQPTLVGDVAQSSFTIFNDQHGQITIKGEFIEELIVFDPAGRMLMQFTPRSDQATLSLPDPGIYIFSLKTNSGPVSVIKVLIPN